MLSSATHPGWRRSSGRIGAIALLLLSLLFLAAPLHAQTFPKYTGLVVDAADVLSDEETAALAARLEALQQATGRQLVVATIPDLEGYPIEDYGYRLGRAWGVGLKSLDNGAILIVAPKDRRVRVEVGYGLTPVITDALSSVIINSRILPAFRTNREDSIPTGIAAGADALIEQLSLPDEEARARVLAAVEQQKAERSGGSVFPLIFWGIVLAIILLSMFRSRGRGRRYRRGGMPVILWGPGFGGGWGSGGGGGSSGGGGWMGGGFSGGGGGSFGGGGASGSW